jgi:hypothetical protein
MTRFIDLTAVSAVQDQMKKAMQPYIESQKVIQDFIDAHQSQFNSIASAVADFQETAQRMTKLVDFPGILESYKEAQKLKEQMMDDLKIPALPIFEPSQFGSLYANVLEEQEALPLLLPNRQRNWVDKDDIALSVSDCVDEKQVEEESGEVETDERYSTIQRLAFLPRRNEGLVTIVINGDYTKSISVRWGKYWEFLIRAAEGERFSYLENRGTVDYFNTNRRCPLYTQGEYELTRILGKDYEFTVFKVSVEILTPKMFQTRLNKMLKST